MARDGPGYASTGGCVHTDRAATAAALAAVTDAGPQIARVTVMVTFGQLFAQEVRADFSALSTVKRQRSFTATHSLM
jgi:hypothetical protein